VLDEIEKGKAARRAVKQTPMREPKPARRPVERLR
jgi:hypothetical protein